MFGLRHQGTSKLPLCEQADRTLGFGINTSSSVISDFFVKSLAASRPGNTTQLSLLQACQTGRLSNSFKQMMGRKRTSVPINQDDEKTTREC